MIIDKIEEAGLKILEKIGLKFVADWYIKHQEGMRYLIFGGLSTFINIIIFALCIKILSLPTTISNVIAWIITVLFAYITNKIYVFKEKKDNIKELVEECISFFAARVLTLIIETFLLWILIDKLHYNEIIMKIISNILGIILNFIFSKTFIFKKNK